MLATNSRSRFKVVHYTPNSIIHTKTNIIRVNNIFHVFLTVALRVRGACAPTSYPAYFYIFDYCAKRESDPRLNLGRVSFYH